ncbi:alpha/beta fold hydrolase [Massilia sp. MS-15]|uniref:alpha/beta fold hydrolase n=1 Tax=Massilia sp. MS-15 TaxID=2878200 RepID=UPI001CD1C10E|nr:alpha/beta hydrolase [Massilia sp. MS-15]MCA1246628.1 alpha/beta hydrolase [Massilia sp. MS-15]
MSIQSLYAAICAASLAALGFAASPALAQPAPEQPNRFLASQPVAVERFELKGMLVEQHGNGPRALVLVPGLSSGSWAWGQTVRDFAPTHSVYVVTLPGFDGRPAVDGDPFDASRAALAELIASRKLAKPVVVGHSLGATLALALAQEAPQLVGGVVAIDGLPVFPRTEQLAPEQRAQLAQQTRQRMATLAGPAFAAQQLQYMRAIGMVDMGKADDAARLSARSDPRAVADYMGALLARDLRPGLGRISAPMLLLVPYYAPDAPLMNNISAAEKQAYYRDLMDGTPRLDVEIIDKARHFAMIDQPEAVAAAIRRFLARL